MAKPLIIGSRGSALALWQARFIAAELFEHGIETSIEIIKTTGDHLQTASLTEKGGKGLFTKEIEEALLAGKIDLAVHSLKDLPTQLPERLALAAVPPREDARDALLGEQLQNLPPAGHVGTSSERRAAQLKLLRPTLRISPIRGNVDTRIRKLKEGQFDAIVLAVAGLRRLNLSHEIAQVFTPHQMCPAPAQGALGIETREEDVATREACAKLNDPRTAQAVLCERTVLAALGGGCQLPLGAYAEAVDDHLHVTAIVISPDGSRHVRASANGPFSEAMEVGQRIAEDLLLQGAQRILYANA